jgi:hypothetical protein
MSAANAPLGATETAERERHKPIICLDFDGVIHSYEHGWADGTIYGHATPGFFEWANEAAKHFRLVIFSTRSSQEGGISDMQMWLHRERKLWRASINGGAWQTKADETAVTFEFATEKPPAFVSIDDRGMTFDGNWSRFEPEMLIAFKTWIEQKREASHGI